MSKIPTVNIAITGLHLEKDPDLKKYAHKKTKKLLKYSSHIQDINVRLISEKAHRGQEKDYYCELVVKVPGKTLEIVDSEREMGKAVDKAVDRMKRLLIRYREKQISKLHKKGIINKLLNRLRS